MGKNLCSDTLLNQSKYVDEQSNGVLHILEKIRITLIVAKNAQAIVLKSLITAE